VQIKEWEKWLYRDAAAIAIIGASNPMGVVNTLDIMLATARAEGLDHREIENHPAIRAVVGHLAFLFGQAAGPDDDSFLTVRRISDEIREVGV
jgi:hypothetical protein